MEMIIETIVNDETSKKYRIEMYVQIKFIQI